MKYKVGKKSDFKNHEIKSFEFDENKICVVLHDAKLHAFQNTCPHQHMPLDMGLIRDNTVVCTLHGWKFDLETGRCESNPTCNLPIYSIETEGDEIFVQVEEK